MRHLKRFKNWIAVVYYACWSYTQQFQNQNDQSQPDQVEHDDFSAALEAEVAAQIAARQQDESEVQAQQQVVALELLDTIAQGTSEKTVATTDDGTPTPTAEAEQTSEVVPAKPVEVSSAPVVASTPVAQPTPVVVSTQVKQPGTNGKSTQSQAGGSKYQPGAINEQTAQRLARLLVSEIKLYHKSKTEGEDATDVKNVYDMLKDPIDKSRLHYRQRLGKTAIETMPDYFHGELVRALCEGDASRLGPNYTAMDKGAH
jgi:hypothetical protein